VGASATMERVIKWALCGVRSCAADLKLRCLPFAFVSNPRPDAKLPHSGAADQTPSRAEFANTAMIGTGDLEEAVHALLKVDPDPERAAPAASR
jgi:hypothetical protein